MLDPRAPIVLVALLSLALLLPGAALAVDTGSANFTNYVSAGDSLTAGYQSNSLLDVSQKNSYPAIIARQAGVADFEQPLVSPPGIPGVLVLPPTIPLIPVPSPGFGHPENTTLPRLYNNLAVPGESVHSMLTVTSDVPATGRPGPHDLVLRGINPGGHPGTQLVEVLAAQPTFVTLWIGNNDVLGAATQGNLALLTPVASFTADYNTIVGAIASTGAKMAIANIPDVSAIAYVNTVPTVLTDFTKVPPQPVLVNGNLVPLIGPNGPLGPGDRVLLHATADLAKGLGIPKPLGGTGLPLPAHDVLLAADVQTISQRVDQFNAVIAAAAQRVGAALVDIHALFNNLAANGIVVGGIPFTAAFLTGGVFSYDGVHPTPFGYAFTANVFIDAINQNFGANIPEADLSASMFGTSAVTPAAARGEESVVERGGGETDGQQTLWTPFIFSYDVWRSLESVLTTPGGPAPSGGGGGHHRHPHG
jgi:lysophospholipase L1-like esterase